MTGTPGRRRRVAVTGLGVICALGRDQREFWAGAMEGRCGISELTLFDPEGCLSRVAAEVRTVRPPRSIPLRERRRLSRTDLLCLIASEEAVGQAGLAGDAALKDFGVSLGTSSAGMLEAEEYCREALERGRRRARPSRVLRLPTSAPADAVARHFGTFGPRLSNMTACASSAAAIGIAADLIREGDVPGVICGGGDALCRMTFAGFNALRLVDVEACRPFDAGRQGLSLGEGAGILILEEWERSLGRGVRPLAEFMDYGCSCDAHHMTGPHPEGRGAAAAMIEAMEGSGLSPEKIGHVNAHGTGTPMNDSVEGTALRAALGPEISSRVPLTSTKSMVGHLLGGAGGIEAATLVLSLMHQAIPPTLGWRRGDPGIDLNVVAPSSRRTDFEYGLSNSFGFGGTNCSLLFRRVG